MIADRTIARQQRAVAQMLGPSTVVLRRGDATLAAQPGLVAVPVTLARDRRGEASRAAEVRAELWGLPTLDVQVGDRLTFGGVAFRVVFVRPDRAAATIADVETLS